MSYKLYFTQQAQKDAKRLGQSINLKKKTQKLLDLIKENPYKNPPIYEKLIGDLSGAFSRRINIQHRLVYQVFEEEKIIKIIRLWTHYE